MAEMRKSSSLAAIFTFFLKFFGPLLQFPRRFRVLKCMHTSHRDSCMREERLGLGHWRSQMGSQQSVFTEDELQLYQVGVLLKLTEVWEAGQALFDYVIKHHFMQCKCYVFLGYSSARYIISIFLRFFFFFHFILQNLTGLNNAEILQWVQLLASFPGHHRTLRNSLGM